MIQMQQTKSPESLIKYQTEIQVSQNADEYKKQKQDAPVLQSKPSSEDVLNAIIPPREWADPNNHLYIQYVSHQGASRQDVVQLQKILDERLTEKQARQSGICPIRQQLFSQCYDQIIRQVTIDCPQRGLLLMRVRDEAKMTIAAYQTLYQSSVTFGMRKQVESQQGKDELLNQIQEWKLKKVQLEQKRIQLNTKKQSLQKKIAQRQSIQRAKRQSQLQSLVFQAENLSRFLQGIKLQLAATSK